MWSSPNSRWLPIGRSGTRDRLRSRLSHLGLGCVSLLLVTGAFAEWYDLVVRIVGNLYLLSTTSVVFAYLSTWILLWLGLELVVATLAGANGHA